MKLLLYVFFSNIEKQACLLNVSVVNTICIFVHKLHSVLIMLIICLKSNCMMVRGLETCLNSIVGVGCRAKLVIFTNSHHRKNTHFFTLEAFCTVQSLFRNSHLDHKLCCKWCLSLIKICCKKERAVLWFI